MAHLRARVQDSTDDDLAAQGACSVRHPSRHAGPTNSTLPRSVSEQLQLG